MNKRSNFRWDIQGLRAIAILAVVIFHINPTLLPGGYIGVDIFFVISGYLIMGFIWRDLQNKNFDLLRFYIKRIYRLFPALFVTVVISSIAAYFILLPTESESYIKSLISTLFYFSNFYFYSESDYFNTAMEFAPLLHTWSLSVEEQFYLLFPLILIFIYRQNKIHVSIILLVLAVLSLLMSEIFISKDTAFAFFSSPTRFFQFIIGGLIAISMQKNILSKHSNDLLGGIGLILISVSMFIYNNQTLFPGLNALLPSVGAALLLYSGMNAKYTTLILTNSAFRFIGNTSYSIYLWHWPLIVFYKLKFSPNLSIYEQVGLFILSILFGYLSWQYIENRTKLKKTYTINLRPIYYSIGISIFLSSFIYMIFTFYPHKSKVYEYLDYDTSHFRDGTCFLTSKYNNVNLFNKKECITHTEGKKNYLLLGDSHAAQYYSALNTLINNNETLTQVTSSGCPPVLDYTGRQSCVQLIKWAYEELITEKHFDTIILVANWGYFKKERTIKSIKELRKHTDRVVVLGPTMQYEQYLPRLLTELPQDQDRSMIYKTAGRLTRQSRIDRQMRNDLNIDKVKYISILDTQCSTTSGCTTLTPENIPLNFDKDHLTYGGALYSLEQVKDAIFDREK